MIGCGSVGMADGGHMAASLYHQLQADHLSPPEYRVFPHCPLPLEALQKDLDVTCPALIKAICASVLIFVANQLGILISTRRICW